MIFDQSDQNNSMTRVGNVNGALKTVYTQGISHREKKTFSKSLQEMGSFKEVRNWGSLDGEL